MLNKTINNAFLALSWITMVRENLVELTSIMQVIRLN